MNCFSMSWLLSFVVPLGMTTVLGFMELLRVQKIVVIHIPRFHQSPGIPGITFGQIQGSLQVSCNAIPAASPSLPAQCHNLMAECKGWGALSSEPHLTARGLSLHFMHCFPNVSEQTGTSSHPIINGSHTHSSEDTLIPDRAPNSSQLQK